MTEQVRDLLQARSGVEGAARHGVTQPVRVDRAQPGPLGGPGHDATDTRALQRAVRCSGLHEHGSCRGVGSSLAQVVHDGPADVAHSEVQQRFVDLARNRRAVGGGAAAAQNLQKQFSVMQLISAYRFQGNRVADIDPLKLVPIQEQSRARIREVITELGLLESVHATA